MAEPLHNSMFDSLFRTEAGLRLFAGESLLQKMLDFEAALAIAEASVGEIPDAAADVIAQCCHAEAFYLVAIAEGTALSGNPAIPMVKQLTQLVRAKSESAAAFVHWGATSQDAMDCALVLQLREELALLDRDVARVQALLHSLTVEHRDALMAGRTWMQHAVPITFGLKTAGWLEAMQRHRERLMQMKARVLVLQFGGAAGTLASLGERGAAISAALGKHLQLTVPALPWHSLRDGAAEVATLHGLIMGTLGKIARDFSLMMQTEVAELAEPSEAGRGGSSTMPHKRNPVRIAAILSSALRIPGLVSTMLASQVQEGERGLGGWHSEWETLPDICMLTLGALTNMISVLDGLQVFPQQMRRNLEMTQGLVLAEAVSMELAKTLGKQRAHGMLEEASRVVLETGETLAAVLQREARVTAYLNAEEIDRLLDPKAYLGSIQAFIDRVLADDAGKEESR